MSALRNGSFLTARWVFAGCRLISIRWKQGSKPYRQRCLFAMWKMNKTRLALLALKSLVDEADKELTELLALPAMSRSGLVKFDVLTRRKAAAQYAIKVLEE
jgi:hypothetical protein